MLRYLVIAAVLSFVPAHSATADGDNPPQVRQRLFTYDFDSNRYERPSLVISGGYSIVYESYTYKLSVTYPNGQTGTVGANEVVDKTPQGQAVSAGLRWRRNYFGVGGYWTYQKNEPEYLYESRIDEQVRLTALLSAEAWGCYLFHYFEGFRIRNFGSVAPGITIGFSYYNDKLSLYPESKQEVDINAQYFGIVGLGYRVTLGYKPVWLYAQVSMQPFTIASSSGDAVKRSYTRYNDGDEGNLFELFATNLPRFAVFGLEVELPRINLK